MEQSTGRFRTQGAAALLPSLPDPPSCRQGSRFCRSCGPLMATAPSSSSPPAHTALLLLPLPSRGSVGSFGSCLLPSGVVAPSAWQMPPRLVPTARDVTFPAPPCRSMRLHPPEPEFSSAVIPMRGVEAGDGGDPRAASALQVTCGVTIGCARDIVPCVGAGAELPRVPEAWGAEQMDGQSGMWLLRAQPCPAGQG